MSEISRGELVHLEALLTCCTLVDSRSGAFSDEFDGYPTELSHNCMAQKQNLGGGAMPIDTHVV